MWHSVDCEGDEGSLSVNFSVSGARWADIVARRVMMVSCVRDRAGGAVRKGGVRKRMVAR